MLTRSQVAKRLGKSIATVRRLEGDRLHPRRDEAGIHRFDAAEVGRLARELASGQAVPPRLHFLMVTDAQRTRAANIAAVAAGPGIDALHDEAPLGDSCSMTEHHERAGLHARVRALEGELSRQEVHARVLAQRDQQVVATMTQELIYSALAMSDRELRRVGPSMRATPRAVGWGARS